MMKWWGWGDKNFTFPMQTRPDLWPWIKGQLGIEKEELSLPNKRESIKLPSANINLNFLRELESVLKTDQITSDDDERLLHAYGKSFPDLFRVRNGIIRKAPDLVLLPENHAEVEGIIKLAHQHNVSVIPFGGGTNIVGGVDPLDLSGRMIVTLDLRRMNRVLSIDPQSNTATIQGGALGPKLEEDLQAKGFSLGHYPDSFEYSTLGGWLATRSAGMQSDAYGKIEHMLVSLKVVTPSGTIATRLTPASSAGPDLNQLMVGSEGILGVITEATMRVHKAPLVKDYRGFLFKSFEDGVRAIEDCLASGFAPSMIRLQDSYETQLALNLKVPKKGFSAWIQKPIKAYLKRTGYTAPSIMIVGFEGNPRPVSLVRNDALKILKRHGGFSLGKSVGKTWSVDKFNVPYLRDWVMDYGVMVDVAETATVWSQVVPLYRKTIDEMKAKFARESTKKGYIGCHISHTYKTGASLYFTYGVKQIPGKELDQYYGYKHFVTDTFVKNGGTLTHHHAVGYEHTEWMEEEVSRTGLQALEAVKDSLDPKGILNPGKLLPRKDERTVEKTASLRSERSAPSSLPVFD